MGCLLILQDVTEGDKVGNALFQGCKVMCRDRALLDSHEALSISMSGANNMRSLPYLD